MLGRNIGKCDVLIKFFEMKITMTEVTNTLDELEHIRHWRGNR
jgi:hypothetical protein